MAYDEWCVETEIALTSCGISGQDVKHWERIFRNEILNGYDYRYFDPSPKQNIYNPNKNFIYADLF